jgi:hypothetical protein
MTPATQGDQVPPSQLTGSGGGDHYRQRLQLGGTFLFVLIISVMTS